MQAQYSAEQVIITDPTLWASDLALGDIDQDGDLDVAGICQGWGRSAWQRNIGNGQFDPAIPVLDGSFGVSELELGDVDADGDLDIITHRDLATLILLRNGGYGNFGAPEILATGPGAYSFRVGDLDLDGDLDIVQAADLSIEVLLNNGSGYFVQQPSQASAYALTEIALEQIDGSGPPDLVILSATGDRIVHRTNQGGGVFGPPVTVYTTTALLQVLETGDADGDGDVDLTATVSFNHLLFRNDGSGAFSLTDTLVAGMAVRALHFSDLDADGSTDVAYYDQSTGLRWRKGVNNVDWDPPQVLGSIPGCSALAVADLDADGRTDVVAACPVTWSGFFSSLQTSAGVFTTAALTPRFRRCEVGLFDVDVDGDGDKDLLSATLDTAGVSWYENLGYFSFAPGRTLLGVGIGATSVGVGDLDNDGDVDIAATFAQSGNGLTWFRNTGGATFTQAQVLSTATVGGASILVRDVDNDGDLDILAGASTNGVNVYLNDGAGVFTAMTSAPTAFRVASLVAGDLNGDGFVDLASYSTLSALRQVSVNLNLGNGTFGPEVSLNNSPGTVMGLTVGDVDNDGDLDLCYDSGQQDHVVWMANDGTGGFGPVQWIEIDARVGRVILIMDHDLDGVNDVLLSTYDGNSNGPDTFHRHRGLGGGVFAPADTFLLSNGAFDVLYHMDLNGDGAKDLVTGSSNGWIGVRENVGLSPYAVSGEIYHDADLDGTRSPGEPGLPFVLLTCDPVFSTPTSNGNGGYGFYLDSAAYVLKTTVPDAWWQLTTDSLSYTVALNDLNPTRSGLDFGYAPALDTTLLVPSVTSSRARCAGGGPAVQWLSLANLGTTRPSGVLAYQLGANIAFIQSVPAPDSLSNGVAYWSFDSLGYYQTPTIELTVLLPTAVNTPVTASLLVWTRNGSSVLELTATEVWADVVSCSFDPNDKMVSPAGDGPDGRVDLTTPHLDYTIRFQNTGTDTAYVVEVRDILDPDLDRNSFQFLGASHALTSVVMDAGGEIAFRFENILLPDSNVNELASHGFIRFRMRPGPNMPNGTVVTNTAAIHFDQNAPVITNTTFTTFVDCAALIAASVTVTGSNVLSASPGESYQWFKDGLAIPGADQQDLLVTANGNYHVVITGAFGCTDESDAVFVGTTDLPAPDRIGMGLVPNPVSGQAMLILASPLAPDVRIELLSAHGQRVRQWRAVGADRIMLDLGQLPSGLYVLRVTGDRASYGTLKVVVD